MKAILELIAKLMSRGKEAELTAGDRELGEANGIPDDLLQKVKAAGDELRQLEGMDEDCEATRPPGVTIDVKHSRAKSTAQRLQANCPAGYFAFVSGSQFGIYGAPDQVSILKAASRFDILAAIGTNGWNYDIGPQTLMERTREWDARFGLTIWGAGDGWLEAEFVRRPDDMMAFAEEVFALCPDVVTQGTKTVAALAAEMKRNNAVYLWWD